jgi:hypothetical protein
MKTLITLLALFPLFISQQLAAKNTVEYNQQILEQEAKQRIKAFGKQLKTTLKAAISADGINGGVQACKLAVPAINLQHKTDHWQVARTSLKVRNKANVADSWELKQLQFFEQQKAQGVNIKTLSASTIVTHENGAKEFRFIKAIPTQQLCLKCHGENINPETLSLINDLYPDDKAAGFKLGDIRGAFSVSKKL